MHYSNSDYQSVMMIICNWRSKKDPKTSHFMQFVLTKICRVIAEYVSLSVNYT